MLKTESLTRRIQHSRWFKTASDWLPDVVTAIGVVWLVALFFLNAWVSEDAYITYRVIDNFHQGYGLRWNIYERVQAYTHPLWMMLHLPVYALWNNIFHASIAISVICSAAAIIVVLHTSRKPVAIMVFCLFLPLAWSKSFMDYTSSGLENPLSYLLFALFGYVMVRKQESPYFWFLCSLSVALSLTNRLDTAIIYGPTLLWLVLTRWREVRWGQIFLGALPIISWLCFSLLYYGFLLPNTKYAKLNTSIAVWQYVKQGFYYAKYFAIMDMASAIMIVFPLGYILYALRKRHVPASEMIPWFPVSLAVGIYYYCAYVIYIGGDYMIGRFWALPVFASIWLLYIMIPEDTRRDILFTMGCALLVAYIVPQQLEGIRQGCHSCVIGKQRLLDASFTFRGNKLVLSRFPLRLRQEGQYMFANDGKKIANEKRTKAKPMFYIGMGAFYAGATTPLIDELGLADALLARLPSTKRQSFYVGHFKRIIPHGYNHAINTGSTERMNPSIAKYYEKLRLITSGELFDPERLKTIVLFNLGAYDHWKQEYIARNPN